MIRPFRSLRAAALLLGAFAMPAAAVAQTAAPSAPAATPAPAVTPLLGVDEIFARHSLTGDLPGNFTWAPDGRRFLYARQANGGGLATYVRDAVTGSERPFFAAKAEGKGARPVAEFAWSPDGRRVAFLDAGDLYVGDVATGARRRVARGAEDPQFGPGGGRVAYVHAGDIYVSDIASGAVTRVSRDGARGINGEPDWVYSEELAMAHAYAWSPDGTRIAYLHFDERGVDRFPIADFLETDNTVDQQYYPHPGEKNPTVTLRVATVGGGTRELYSTAAHDDYVAALGWTPASVPVAEILDRPQRNATLTAFAAAGTRALWHVSDPVFLDLNSFSIRGRSALGPVRWLRDGRFVAVAPSGGEDVVMLVDPRRGTSRALTSGFHVASIAAVDEARGVVIAAAYPRSRRERTAVAVRLKGGPVRTIDGAPGTHAFTFADDGRRYVETSSAFDTPPTISVGDAYGGSPVVLARSKSLASRGLGRTKLLTIPSQWGPLDATLIVPPDFDESRRYPVLTYVYGGPAAPTTENAWGGTTALFHQALAQRGIVVFSIDGPASRVDRHADRYLAGRTGSGMLAGQLAGAAWLKGQPWVDPARLGIWGWSYGGYATTYAMTHAPGVWKAGFAVAPVTDWRFYDSIYTERYMGDPKRQKKSYDDASVLPAAGRLQGALTIAHGTSDDNVHMANTLALQQAFILAGKHVDTLFYPRKTHGISGVPQRRHLFGAMLAWWQRQLGDGSGAGS